MSDSWSRREKVARGVLTVGVFVQGAAAARGQEGPTPTEAAGTVAIEQAPFPTPSPEVVLPSPQSVPVPIATPGCGRSPLPCETNVPVLSIKQLVRMSAPELDQLYQQSGMGALPGGRLKGRVILYPGTKLAGPASTIARALWQGKVIDCDQRGAVNKFFGLKVIRANVYPGESWMDGRPSVILDYSQTSLLYAPYRDEIREVGPGLFLGLMYSRTQPQPTFKMYFALQAQP